MLTSPFQFGDVLKDSSCEFVFLAQTLSAIYLARILTDLEMVNLIRLKELYYKKAHIIEDPPIYWYVELTADNYQGRAVTLAKVQYPVHYGKVCKKLDSERLNRNDLLGIRDLILGKRTAPELKEEVVKIKI